MKHFYQKIEGYMNEANIIMLNHVLNLVPNNCQWVELGSWTGKSAAYCAVELINRNKFGRFVTIDSWNGCDILKEHNYVKNNSIKDIFLKNMEPIIDKIETVQSISWEASQNFVAESIDFCYVDAGHSYDDVLKDLNSWWPKIKLGSWFGGDDYTYEFPGLVSAVDNFFKDKNLNVQKIGRCWLIQKI